MFKIDPKSIGINTKFGKSIRREIELEHFNQTDWAVIFFTLLCVVFILVIG